MKIKHHTRIPLLSKEWIGMVLLLAEIVLILVSWILSATMMEGVRSLLSSEGIRWFVGGFTDMLASPFLVWFIILLLAFGSYWQSGVASLFTSRSLFTYREKIALRVSLILLIIYCGVVALLTLPPHAILISATGNLFPSAFSRSLIPLIAFGICLFSITFGVMSGRMKTLSDILDSLSFGIRKGAPFFILYILLMQFYQSLRFVFGEIW